MIQGIVALVGRPNVGKSTLFNKLTKSNSAIIDDQPGVTRDRMYGTVESLWSYTDGFTLIDTGGFETKDINYQPFSENIVWKQTEAAIDEADVVVLMFDGKSGLHPHDRELVRKLQRQGKEVVYVVNKIDGYEQKDLGFEFYALGVDDIDMISAAHSKGIRELREEIEERLDKLGVSKSQYGEIDSVKVALVGRPNAGKSSILNRMIGEERALVSDIAGTTRDSVNMNFNFNKNSYTLIDTAGIRRRAKVKEKVEAVSMIRSLIAVENTDIVVLVIDAAEGLTDQDKHLASLAVKQHKPLLIVVNKWDLIPNKDSNSAREYTRDIHDELRDMQYIPVIFVSCLANQRIHKIMSEVEGLAEQYKKRSSTASVNNALRQMVFEHTPALIKKFAKRPKFYFATQVPAMPPTIVVFCNVSEDIQPSYKRYMNHKFRKYLAYNSIPLQLVFRDKEAVRARKEDEESYQNYRASLSEEAQESTPQI